MKSLILISEITIDECEKSFFFIIKNQKRCCEKNPVARNVLKLKQQLQDNLQIINIWISKEILDDPEHELIGKYLGTNVIYSQNKRFVKSMIIYIYLIYSIEWYCLSWCEFNSDDVIWCSKKKKLLKEKFLKIIKLATERTFKTTSPRFFLLTLRLCSKIGWSCPSKKSWNIKN